MLSELRENRRDFSRTRVSYSNRIAIESSGFAIDRTQTTNSHGGNIYHHCFDFIFDNISTRADDHGVTIQGIVGFRIRRDDMFSKIFHIDIFIKNSGK